MSHGIIWGKNGLVEGAASAEALGQGHACVSEDPVKRLVWLQQGKWRKQCEKGR